MAGKKRKMGERMLDGVCKYEIGVWYLREENLVGTHFIEIRSKLHRFYFCVRVISFQTEPIHFSFFSCLSFFERRE